MTEETLRALLHLSEVPFKNYYKIANLYWPDGPEFDTIRREQPWWLVWTPSGTIQMGWRKRVISIDWSDTTARTIVTKDDVTKQDTYVHAWSYAKAVEYLTALSPHLTAL